MKKTLLIIIIAVLTLGLILLKSFGSNSSIKPTPPSPEPVPTLKPIIRHSKIFVPVNLSANLIAKTIEENTPKTVNESKRLDIGGPVRQEKVTVTGTRSKLKTKLGKGGISVSGSIDRLRAQFTARFDLLLGSTGLSQSARGNIKFNLSAKPQFKSDWKIDPNLKYKFVVPTMNMRVARIGNISVRGKTTEALNSGAKKIATRYKDNFPLNEDFKEGVSKLWLDAHQVIKINDAPKTWAVIRPKTISVAQPVFTEADMRLGVGLEVENLVISSNKQPTLEVNELPKTLQIVEEPSSDNLVFSLPIALEYTAINAELNNQIAIKNPSIEENIAGEKIKLTIDKAKIIPSGNGMIIEADIKSKSGGLFGKKINGKVYLIGTPMLNKASKTLAFTELNYHVDTHSALVNAAGYLLKPVVLDAIEKELIIDLGNIEAEGLAKAKTEITKLNQNIPQGVNIELDPTALKLTDLIISEKYLHAIIDVNGKIGISVDDNFFITP